MNGVYIPSLDGKDIVVATEAAGGATLLLQDGTVNLKKFVNVLDFSLDLIALREVYQKKYRNQYFSFWIGQKEFTTRCINLTFKYSNKEFNQFGPKLYVKFGYQPADIQLKDCVCVKNNELIAVQIDTPLPPEAVVSQELLNENFKYDGTSYKLKKNATLHNVAAIRNKLYTEGFYCDGVHYVRFKRSSGSSRVGKCLFIDEKLYPAMHKFEMLGIKLKKGQEVDLAALEAYISLTLSSIIDTIEIKPENVLVIDDYDSVFDDRVAATYIENSGLTTQEKIVTIKNSIWDGQSLIDKSLMGTYACYGMILLRTHFFKSCCFNTNIQQFFADNNITDVSQLNGFTLAKSIEDIKLITTPNSIKFLKFGTLEEWLSRIGCTFGVVKHEKKTHFFDGRMVQVHYQLLNTLQISKEEMREFLKPTLEYMDLLKTDPAVMRYHIHFPEEHRLSSSAVKSQDEIVFRLLGITDKFSKTQLYHEFCKKNLLSFKNSLRYGHVFVNGNYSTLVGNPLEMLLQSIGRFTGESCLGVGNIHSTRFEYGKSILGSRSPHVCVGNVLLVNNVANKKIDKYFNLTNEIVCINSIGENILQKLNGADFDSDSILLTDDPLLIKAAQKNYGKFLVPTNLVESRKTQRFYTDAQKADLDIKTAVNKIGEIINLSQRLQSFMWHQINNGASIEDVKQLYLDICQLAVMSNIEIDSAKKEFDISNAEELEKLRMKWQRFDEQGRYIEPYFFEFVSKAKGFFNDKRKAYVHHDTSMDYLEEIVKEYRSPAIRGGKIPLTDILDVESLKLNRIHYKQAELILSQIRIFKYSTYTLFQTDNENLDSDLKYQFYEDKRTELINYINEEAAPNRDTLLYLLKNIESDKNNDIKNYLVDILFNIGNNTAFELIKASAHPIAYLEEAPDGDVVLYGAHYTKTYKK